MVKRAISSWIDAMTELWNTAVSGVGAPIASATIIYPSAPIHHVTGAVAIQTIALSTNNRFSGTIVLIPDGAWTMTTADNIALAVTAVVNRALWLVYDGLKWHPSYV